MLPIGKVFVTGGYFSYQSLYRRLPWAVWCLALVVLVNVYTGTLTSMLTAPNYHILANSMEDVAANPTIRPKTFAMSLTSEVIKVNQHHVWINDVVTSSCLCRTRQSKPLKRFSSGCKILPDHLFLWAPTSSMQWIKMKTLFLSALVLHLLICSRRLLTAKYHPLWP